MNNEQGYEREVGLLKRYPKQPATAVNIPSLTTNQKVAGSSPAERFCRGHALIRNLCNGFSTLTATVPRRLRLLRAWPQLAQVIWPSHLVMLALIPFVGATLTLRAHTAATQPWGKHWGHETAKAAWGSYDDGEPAPASMELPYRAF